MANEIHEKDHVIRPEDALEHALLALARATASGLYGVGAWSSAYIREQPVVVHDLNGHGLFYDFEVTRNERTIGYARVAANGIIGTTDVALELGVRHWDFARMAEKLVSQLRRDRPDAQFGQPQLVCYGYPKLGLLFKIAGGERLIFDIGSGHRIPERADGPRVEGALAWSFFDSLSDPERRARLGRYEVYEAARLAIPFEARQEIVRARSVETAARLSKVRLELAAQRTLQYCSHYEEGEPRAHHCFSLQAQDLDDYCAVAVCQMVLCYYRYFHTQDQIAEKLEYEYGTGCPPDHSDGYQTLTCNHLVADYDEAPTWEKARDEIDALHPFKSGVPDHARACVGYAMTTWLQPAGITEKKLYVYDPSPWHEDPKLGGQIYWEDWDSIEHTNYVTARLNCP